MRKKPNVEKENKTMTIPSMTLITFVNKMMLSSPGTGKNGIATVHRDDKWYITNPISKVEYGIAMPEVAAAIEFLYGIERAKINGDKTVYGIFHMGPRPSFTNSSLKSTVAELTKFVIAHDVGAYRALLTAP